MRPDNPIFDAMLARHDMTNSEWMQALQRRIFIDSVTKDIEAL